MSAVLPKLPDVILPPVRSPIVRPPTGAVLPIDEEGAGSMQRELTCKRCKANLHSLVMATSPGEARIALIGELQAYLESLRPGRSAKSSSVKSSMLSRQALR